MRKRGIKYLRKLVETYRLFTHWKGVLVIEDGKTIHVIWITPNEINVGNRKNIEFATSIRTFPKGEIPRRITSYREKIKREFAKRNDK